MIGENKLKLENLEPENECHECLFTSSNIKIMAIVVGIMVIIVIAVNMISWIW